jgi:hypothetical protein
MLVNRRRFLKILGIGSAIILTGAIFGKRLNSWFLVPVRALYKQLTVPVLADKPTGSLNAATIEALLATTEILVGTPIEKSHYKDYFCWRSENLRGYKALYERFMTMLDNSARQFFNSSFVKCKKNDQYSILEKILEKAFQVSITRTDRVDRIRSAVFKRDLLLFEKYIFSEILYLFSKTDAWILLGYESWPGTPRGLETYQQAPAGARRKKV